MTINANARLTITLSVLAALFVTFVVAYNIGKPEAITLSDRVLNECEIKDVSEESGTTDDVAAILLSAGWYGIGGDGGEILYSPACIDYDYIP